MAGFFFAECQSQLYDVRSGTQIYPRVKVRRCVCVCVCARVHEWRGFMIPFGVMAGSNLNLKQFSATSQPSIFTIAG